MGWMDTVEEAAEIEDIFIYNFQMNITYPTLYHKVTVRQRKF